jgi:hypothetical protein
MGASHQRRTPQQCPWEPIRLGGRREASHCHRSLASCPRANQSMVSSRVTLAAAMTREPAHRYRSATAAQQRLALAVSSMAHVLRQMRLPPATRARVVIRRVIRWAGPLATANATTDCFVPWATLAALGSAQGRVGSATTASPATVLPFAMKRRTHAHSTQTSVTRISRARLHPTRVSAPATDV